MGKRGIRSQKGQPETEWGEPKTGKITVALTETGKQLARERADRVGFSLSEIFERWARGFVIDQDDAILAPPEQILNDDVIVKALPRLTKPQVARIVWAGLNLLIGTLYQPNQLPQNGTTIAELVRGNRDRVIEMFDEAIDEPTKRIDAIANGDKPTIQELALLSAALPIDDDELMRMYKREFPNGNTHQGSLQNH